VSLVACSAEHLPFRDDSFDLVVAGDVIEHVPDPVAMVRSCHRVLRGGGSLWLATPNRLSPTPEPHVRLWGVGYLPRPLGRAYVRLARGTDYHEINTLSHRRLARVLEATGGRGRIVAPPIVPATKARHGRLARLAIGVYNGACRVPVVSKALLLVAPLFHAVVRKEDAQA
jgi:SAM-dependent methyltransferase